MLLMDTLQGVIQDFFGQVWVWASHATNKNKLQQKWLFFYPSFSIFFFSHFLHGMLVNSLFSLCACMLKC